MSAARPSPFLELDRTLSGETAGTRAEALRYDADHHIHCGIETRTDPRDYDWDGLRRGGRREHPTMVVQYTLDGVGAFEQGGQVWRLEPGALFAAVIPSAHRYYLPKTSPRWRFFWFVLRHPYVISRWAQKLAEFGPVLAAPPDGPLLAKMVQLFEGIARQNFRDVLAWESATIDVMLEYERTAQQTLYPQTPRDRLLDQVRAEVMRHLHTGVGVTHLAARWKMSRSAFSHHFKATTALTPASYITELRLQEASRRLLHTGDKLATIARETGFADANHLCKVFRRHYHMSPGQYRKHLR